MCPGGWCSQYAGNTCVYANSLVNIIMQDTVSAVIRLPQLRQMDLPNWDIIM